MIRKLYWVFVATVTYGALDHLVWTMDRQQVSLDRHLPFGGVIAPQARVNLHHVKASLIPTATATLTTNVRFKV
jgi:hypothetical protein